MWKLMILQLQRIGGASMSCRYAQVLTDFARYARTKFEFNPIEFLCLLVLIYCIDKVSVQDQWSSQLLDDLSFVIPNFALPFNSCSNVFTS